MKILTLILLIFTLNNPVNAQEQLSRDDFSAGNNITFKAEEDIQEELGESDVTIIRDKHKDAYVEPTLENISRLYWKKNALDIKNDTAIDNFLLINECDLYEKFYNDDFEWVRVRKAARDLIEQGRDDFAHKFKVVVPIDLGRYDEARKGFPLINKTAFNGLRRVEIGGNSYREDRCGNDGIIEHYPRNIILILNKPFTFDFIELDEHIAQALIIRHKYQEIDRPRELQNKEFNRLAYARMRITFSEYQGATKGRDSFPLGVMFGKLDGIDIFEDPIEKRMLASFDYR